MTITINFINTEHNSSIEQFIKSLVMKTFDDAQDLESIIVNMQVQNNNQVPWVCHIYLTDDSENLLEAESQAANYLTAFSQALLRISRQWGKNNNIIRA